MIPTHRLLAFSLYGDLGSRTNIIAVIIGKLGFG